MGAEIEELEDGMIIHGGKELHGAFTDSYGDHRIAMALTVAALGASGKTFIKDGECCQVTYPAFADDFAKLGTSIKESVR
jgi:3-phosphoshikimate 1-carboxyvinyltransferase